MFGNYRGTVLTVTTVIITESRYRYRYSKIPKIPSTAPKKINFS